MLIVTGYVRLDPVDIVQFMDEMKVLSDQTRARDGCLFYAVALEDPLTGRILASERWRDQAALTAHLSAPETLAFVERWKDRMSGEVLKYDVENERPLMESAN